MKSRFLVKHIICLAATLLVVAGCSLRALAQVQIPELPRVQLDTSFSPPTGGTTWVVHAGDDLQAAFNNDQPGDIIELEAGATFTGNFVLPKKRR